MIKPGNCLLSHFNCFLTSKLSWNIEDLKMLALLIILWSLWIFLGHYCYFWYIQAIYVWRLISFYVTSDQNCLPRPSFPQRLREKSAREGPQFWWSATDGIGWRAGRRRLCHRDAENQCVRRGAQLTTTLTWRIIHYNQPLVRQVKTFQSER